MYIVNRSIKPTLTRARSQLRQRGATYSQCRTLSSQSRPAPSKPGTDGTPLSFGRRKIEDRKAQNGASSQQNASKSDSKTGIMAQYKEGFTFRKTGVKAVPIRKHKVGPIEPVRKVKIGPWSPLVRKIEAGTSSIGREKDKNEAKSASRNQAGKEREVERGKMMEYKTTLPLSRIYNDTLSSLTPDLFYELALNPDTPLLILPPVPSSPSLPPLATSTGLPAFEKWFFPNPSTIDRYEPFNFQYISQFGATMLPYELLTPIIPTQDDGTHDVLSDWAAYNALSISHFLPPSPPLSSIISKCLAHAVALGYDPALKVANNPTLASSFSTLIPGVPLSPLQWELLQKYGSLFQQFNSFRAPLQLLVAAASSSDADSNCPSLPGLYIAQAQLPDLPPQLLADLPLPSVLQHLHQQTKGRGADIYNSSIWLGTPPTFTPLHRDPNPNLFIQLHGRKAIRLIPPNEGARLFRDVQARIHGQRGTGTIRGSEMMEGLEKAELRREVWGEKYGKRGAPDGRQEGRGDTVVLGPGDALFVPKGWWHSVMSLGSEVNASVNWWFR